MSRCLIPKRFASYMERQKNYYQILGVGHAATQEEIKKAFVNLTSKLHPDTKRLEDANQQNGWSRRTDTELLMEVKEAYDVLRKPERRMRYDEGRKLAHGEGGHLVEATSARFKGNTIIDLQRIRNDLYDGPGKLNRSAAHFRNPEEEYDKERLRNKSMLAIGAVFVSTILANIIYVKFIHSTGRRKVV